MNRPSEKFIHQILSGRHARVHAAPGTGQLLWPFLLFIVAVSFSAVASEIGVVDTTSTPFARVRTVGLDEVRWTGGFWADRFELCRTQMVPGMDRLMEGTNYSQFFRNFEIAAVPWILRLLLHCDIPCRSQACRQHTASVQIHP